MISERKSLTTKLRARTMSLICSMSTIEIVFLFSSHLEVSYKKAGLFCQISLLWTLINLFWMKRLFSQETFFFFRKRDIFLAEHKILPVCFCFQQNSSFSQLRLYFPNHLKFPAKKKRQNSFFTEQVLVAAFL